MLKAHTITAARGLVRWSQEDLAEASGMSKRTINLIENEKQNPSHDTLLAIEMAFDRKGVVFRDNGLFLEDSRRTILEGPQRLARLLEDVEFSLQGQGELLIDGADESKTPPHIVQLVADMRRRGLKMRHLIKSGDRFMRGSVEEYRWLPEEAFVNQATFIYADTVAFASENEPKIYVHRESNLSDFLRKRFFWLWGVSARADYTIAGDVYDKV